MNLLRTLALGACSLVLVSCTSKQAPQPVAPGSQPISGPLDYSRPHRDGAPWWDIDVSRIPDAVPMPHNGRFKASPYTVMGQRYYPISESRNYHEVGIASWYGTKFHGQATANGEEYDLYGMTAAHKTLPLPSYVRVTNLENGASVILRVNDRGPFYSDRIIDLSFAAAKKLGYAEKGVAKVRVEGIDPHQWWAAQGRPVPMVLAQPKMAAQPTAQAQPVAAAPALETYTPPVNQHAAAVLPSELEVKKNASSAVSGLYLQVGAFANPDAAQLLRDKLSQSLPAPAFISSVERNQQILHRVRLGPLASRDEALRLQDSLSQNNLSAAIVSAD